MATGGSRLDDPEYKNWIRDTLGLMYMKKGLEEFANNQSNLFHAKLCSSVPTLTPCTACCTSKHIKKDFTKRQWFMKCPTCDAWLQQVVVNHAKAPFPILSPDNTNPQLWQSVPWETIKLYMSFGCKPHQSAEDVDVQGLLSMFQNCQFLLQKGHIGRKDLLEELTQIRNTLFHSRNFTVNDSDSQDHLKKMIEFLQGMTGLSSIENSSIQHAILKIQELQVNPLDLYLDKDNELKALNQRHLEVARELRSLEITVEGLQNEMKTQGKAVAEIRSITVQQKLEHDTYAADLGTTMKTTEILQNLQTSFDSELKVLKESIQEIRSITVQQKLEHDTFAADLGTTMKTTESRQTSIDSELKALKESIQTLKASQDDRYENFLQQNERLSLMEQHKIEANPQPECTPPQLRANDDGHLHQSRESAIPYRKGSVSLVTRLMNPFRSKRRGSMPIGVHERTKMTSVSDLQKLLMKHYKRTCLVVPFDNDDVGLEYIYVDPTVKVLRKSKGRDGLKNENEDATSISCRKIFYTDKYKCKQIYITGEAGSGKSVLCKHLVQLWCEAHGCSFEHESEESATRTDSEEDVLGQMKERKQAMRKRHKERESRRKADRKILSQFVFLFHLILRDSQSDYNVNDMIQSQIIKHYESAKGLNISMLLKEENCLFLIDGLDEWICPQDANPPPFVNQGIPGRELSDENSVFLTTTRPWKFDMLKLKSSEVDKHIELCLFDDQSADKLCSKTIHLLNKSHGDCKKKHEFFRKLNSEGLDHFKTIPVIFLQLICLWFHKQELAKTQVQLYCAMIDLLLKKAKKNLSGESTSTSKSLPMEVNLPECIVTHQYCQTNQRLLYLLSKLAYTALFDNTKENSLVFKSSEMELLGLDQDSIKMCLKSGIFSQNKVLEKCSVNEKKMSFLHKKFQEFLASIFIVSSADLQDLVKCITDFCSTLETCLEMSQVWLFIAGLSPNIARQILTHMTDIVAVNQQVLNYRQTIGGDELIIRDIQTCLSDCKTEGRRSGYMYDEICFEDFYITKDTCCHVESVLLCTPESRVKSVHIDTKGIDVDQLRTITSWLEHCNYVQKLGIADCDWPFIPRSTVAYIVGNNCDTLTCLDLYKVTATDELVTAICSSSSKCLKALRLRCVKITHDHKSQILVTLSKASIIKELELWLHCTDHGYKCRDRLDLSAMTQIQQLELWYLNVDNLQSVAHSVEKVELLHATLPLRSLYKFANIISQARSGMEVVTNLYELAITDIGDRYVDMKAFLHKCGLNVTWCQHYVRKKTWRIDFTHS